MIHYASVTAHLLLFHRPNDRVPIGAFCGVELCNFMLVDKRVGLHTWLIYRQLAGSNGRFNVAFF